MLRRTLHYLVSFPWVYDRVQWFFGLAEVTAHVVPFLEHTANSYTVEVGAGTGNWAHLLPPTATYLWLDNDPQKLAGFRAKYPDGAALLCDVATLSLREKSVDYVLSFAVIHHLDDEQLKCFLAEVARVVRKGLILLEPLQSEGLLVSKLLWHYDRGSFPRDLASLREALEEHYHIDGTDEFSVYHAYTVCHCSPKKAEARVRAD